MKFSSVILPFFVSSALALPTQQPSTELVVREQAEKACILDQLLGLGNLLNGNGNGRRDEEIVARANGNGINLNVGGSLVENVVGLLSGLLNGLVKGLTPPAAGASTGTSFPNLGAPTGTSFPNLGGSSGSTGSTGSGGSTNPPSFPAIPKIQKNQKISSNDLLKQLSGFAGFTGGKRELAQGSVFSAMDQLVAHIAQDMPEAKAASVKITEAFNELNAIAQKQAAAGAQKKPAKQN